MQPREAEGSGCKVPGGGSVPSRFEEARVAVWLEWGVQELRRLEVLAGLVGHWKDLGFDPEHVKNPWEC